MDHPSLNRFVFFACGISGRLGPSAFNLILASTLTTEAFAHYQQQLYFALLISPLLYIGSTDRLMQDVQVASLKTVSHYSMPIFLMTGILAIPMAIAIMLPTLIDFRPTLTSGLLIVLTALSACILELTRSYSIISRSVKAVFITSMVSLFTWALLMAAVLPKFNFSHPVLPYMIVASVTIAASIRPSTKRHCRPSFTFKHSFDPERFLDLTKGVYRQYVAGSPLVLLAMTGNLLPLLLNTIFLASNRAQGSVSLTYSLVAISLILTAITVGTQSNWARLYPPGSDPSQIHYLLSVATSRFRKPIVISFSAYAIILGFASLMGASVSFFRTSLIVTAVITIAVFQSVSGIYRSAFLTSRNYIACGLASILSTVMAALVGLVLIRFGSSSSAYSVLLCLLVEQLTCLAVFRLHTYYNSSILS